jgi:diguanylate cyclase
MATRYEQSRERGAEALRTALGYMGQHDACCNPTTFAVWYEYAAGMNARLSRALDGCLRTEPRLGDETIRRLYRDHIAEPDQGAMQQISTELQRVMSGVAENATSTGERAGAFGDQIDGLAVALKSRDPAALAPLLDRALASAAQMKDAAQVLEQQVAASRLEIEHLRADLTRARDEALLDPLTQVLNRKGFDQQLDALLLQEPGPTLSHGLIMIDIDHFKRVNDTHGHVLGDQVIQGLATILRDCVADRDHRVARYGGEEFAILLPHSSVADGLRLAETVRRRAKEMKIRDRRTQQVVLSVTVSAGVAAMRRGDDPSSWIARADGALYGSKQAGRDRVTCG